MNVEQFKKELNKTDIENHSYMLEPIQFNLIL